MQKTAIFGTPHIIRKVLPCKTWNLNVWGHRWFKRSTRKKKPVTRDNNNNYYYFSGTAAHRGLWNPCPRGFLITHNYAPQSVGLLWTSDQLVAETSTWQHNTHNRQISMPPVGFEPTIAAGERP
jgi:hypothetical protein